VDLLARCRPHVDASAVVDGRVLVDGRVVMNPNARVRADASIRMVEARRLRGDIKLSHALDEFAVRVDGRVAMDVGANAGGFTIALLARGARRVHAVDAGVGQLLGRLRADPRVVNLEGCNLGALDTDVVRDALEVITIDVSYLSLADAVPQLERVRIYADADLIALVKPTFELRRGRVAASAHDVVVATDHAASAISRSGWDIIATCDAPATGQHGARESFIHARRRSVP
jgi:23S rRNA (cytidine1920-2'-O)/16S rRNA (cytidine1409-2'-O)-methyltransferase